MGIIFKKEAANEESSTEDEGLKDTKDTNEHSEAVIDSLINSGIPSSVGSVNPPVLASYVEHFPELVKHSKGTLKTNEIRKESQEPSSAESEEDAKNSESKVSDTARRKRGPKAKATRRNQSPRRITRSATKFQELSIPEHDTKDFFVSLNWYESNKSYYDKRLQLVLDDFTSSESSDTGSGKQYYDYLLLDSRVSELTEWPGFIRAVFYAGKGKNRRAFNHTRDAAKVWKTGGESTSKKISRILDIWRGKGAVIVLTVADGLVEDEALTREALVIEALGKQRLCNKNYGSFYGVASVLKAREKHELGATLLVKARQRFLEDDADRVFAPIRLGKQLKEKDESVEPDKEVDNAVLTVLMAEKYSKAQESKRI